jgi:hypothetical protein
MPPGLLGTSISRCGIILLRRSFPDQLLRNRTSVTCTTSFNLTVHVIRSSFGIKGAYVYDWSEIDRRVLIDFSKDMGLTPTECLRGIVICGTYADFHIS